MVMIGMIACALSSAGVLGGTPPTMRAVRTKNIPCTAVTNFSCFEVVDVQTPTAGFGEVLVKVKRTNIHT